MSWTLSDIDKLHQAGKIKGYTVMAKGVPADGKIVKPVEKKEPEGVAFIKEHLDKANIPYSTEYRFHEVRKFRFDIALPLLKIGIEYEGLVSDKSRHTTLSGYTRDATKYNLAQLEGWKVYRYTAKNYKDFENDLKTMIT